MKVSDEPVLRRDLLGAVLVDRRGCRRCVSASVVLERDLVLAEVALALGRLDLHAGVAHAEPDRAQQRLDPAGAEDRVVDVVLVGRRQAGVALVPGLLVAVVEDDELELGADDTRSSRARPAGRAGAAGSGAATRRPARRRATATSASSSAVPGCHGHAAQRGQVGRHDEVAVAALPRRDRVAVDGVHLDVDGEQVVAALGAVLERRRRGSTRASSRLPCSRPCMSMIATTTVSIDAVVDSVAQLRRRVSRCVGHAGLPLVRRSADRTF